MSTKSDRLSLKFLAGASVVALGTVATPVLAQEADDVVAEDSEGDVIIVSGIRASLRSSLNTKKNGEGILDAITAEDIGKFPDTNLAESLQRITGVSIDRTSGEGQSVTVRGFGPDFNLVLMNGRQMPTATLGDGVSPPSSRSFDFGALASESVAGLEVYKSGNALLPTGGIGSVINIKTPRPLQREGLQGSVGVKGVIDNTFEGTKVTPEVSGIISNTWADNTFGIVLTGSYQQRKGSIAEFVVGQYRDGYNGAENSWGSLPQPGSADFANVQNRPGPTDTYQVPQQGAYNFHSFNRERINGQAVLQWAPSDGLEITADYTFSQNTFDQDTNSIGVWFNHGDRDNLSTGTFSSWTDGPVASPNFYGEGFIIRDYNVVGFNPDGTEIRVPITPDQRGGFNGKDLAITGATSANRITNHSLGFNVKWNHPSGFRWEFDGHHSTAEAEPTTPYGSNIAVGSAIFGVQTQVVDFTTPMPVISVDMYPGSEISAANIRPAGNAFRNAYMKDTINQFQLRGGYDFDEGFLQSLDFGVSYVDNKVRTAFGVLQTDSWGGTLFSGETPDSFFTPRDLSADLAGVEGSQSPNIIPVYFELDTDNYIEFLEERVNICSAPWSGTPTGEGCLAEYTTDNTIREKTIAPYVQAKFGFELFENEANLRAGLRYEVTDVRGDGRTTIPGGTAWVADNEIGYINVDSAGQNAQKASYNNWLPAIDLDVRPAQDVIIRASYSHTLARPTYNEMNPAFNLDQPARPFGGSTGSTGDPGLLPYRSENIDLSAEWYYSPDSYVSVGYFNKKVKNFIADNTNLETPFSLPNPAQGAAANAARAALGGNPGFGAILNWLNTNMPEVVEYNPQTGAPQGIIGQLGDPFIEYNIRRSSNTDQIAKLNGWEFAWQHSLWDTGLGFILNYTIVNSDTFYDDTQDFRATQFAIEGVSDSANAVVYYDKNGFQARLAYNWRDGYLGGYSNASPFYIDSFGQLDGNISYTFDNGFQIFGEAINLNKEDRRGHVRGDQATFISIPGYTRWMFGGRYTF